MKLSEIRAVVVEDRQSKADALREQVEGVGGVVIAVITNMYEALMEVSQPRSWLLANTVFLDDQLMPGAGHGYIVYEAAKNDYLAHAIKSPSSEPGLVAVGASGDPSSLTAHRLGANILPRDDSLGSEHWAELFAEHSAFLFSEAHVRSRVSDRCIGLARYAFERDFYG